MTPRDAGRRRGTAWVATKSRACAQFLQQYRRQFDFRRGRRAAKLARRIRKSTSPPPPHGQETRPQGISMPTNFSASSYLKRPSYLSGQSSPPRRQPVDAGTPAIVVHAPRDGDRLLQRRRGGSFNLSVRSGELAGLPDGSPTAFARSPEARIFAPHAELVLLWRRLRQVAIGMMRMTSGGRRRVAVDFRLSATAA